MSTARKRTERAIFLDNILDHQRALEPARANVLACGASTALWFAISIVDDFERVFLPQRAPGAAGELGNSRGMREGMSTVCSLSDSELVARLPALVQTERHAMVEVIEHLVEMERRRLYLNHAVSSLYRYCIEKLGYPEDAAVKRQRVAKLALRLPQVLEELRAGTTHLTGLFLLSQYLTEENAQALLGEARGKSRRQIEEIIARGFPRPDVAPRIELVDAQAPKHAGTERSMLSVVSSTGSPVNRVTCSRAGNHSGPGRLEPLSPARLRVEFTARAEVYDKVEKASELLSHALPASDLGELFERALDALIEKESRKRLGAGKPRKARQVRPGSRHVPIDIERAVRERDGAQCTFVDAEGHRCKERRFLTLEHRVPFALGGPPTLNNLCLLCGAHNLESARRVFGREHIEAKIRARTPLTPPAGLNDRHIVKQPVPERARLETSASVLSSLCRLGFRVDEARAALGRVLGSEPGLDVEQLLRKSVLLLVPAAS